jgi:riboflavin biosynthesis pyrimidine reductase
MSQQPASGDIDHRIASLYGECDWRAATGVLHVAAIEAASRAVIAIGPLAPHSATDRFVLGFARARADILVTTGAILRAEPHLTHRYSDDPRVESEFREWRARVIGRPAPPSLIVLSRSGDLPRSHSALAAAVSGFVWTSPAGRERLGPAVGRLSVESRNDSNGLADALVAARARCPFETALIEAGPRTTSALYESDADFPDEVASCEAQVVRVEELLLSRFEGRLAPEAIGPQFVSEAALASRFRRPPTSTRVVEPSGSWRFERYRDAPGD